jgi:transglutaminase-like putative cysteine protease
LLAQKKPAFHTRSAAVLASLALTLSFSGTAPFEPMNQARAQSRGGARSATQDARPYEARLRSLEAEILRAGRSPRAMIPLLELWRMWNDVPPGLAVDALGRISRSDRLSVPVRQYAAQLLARAHTRVGDPEASERAFDELGFIEPWRVVGPFDNEGKAGFDRAFEPEAERMQAPTSGARFEGRERPVAWRTFPDVSQYGYISFDAVFRPDTNVCAYAETFVTSDRAQPLTLWLGGGGATAAWWNGEEVLRDPSYRQPDPDRAVAMVGAHQGPNRLLVKACVTQTTWGFFARLGDVNGAPATGLTYSTEGNAAEVRAGSGVSRLPRAPSAPLSELESAARGERPNVEAIFDLARYLAYTGSDDPSEMRAKQLAARAAELDPTPARLIFAAQLATARGDAMGFIDRASQLAPADPRVLLARARLVSRGPSPEDALPILDRIPEGTAEWMDGVSLRAELLISLGLPETARTLIDRAAALAEGTPRWVALRVSAASATERHDLAYRLRRELAEIRYDDLGNRRALISDALARTDRNEAIHHLDIYRRLGRDSMATYLAAAEVFDALGNEAEMLGAYRTAIDLAPEDASSQVAYGRALLRIGSDEAGAQVLRDALALRPQDAETRELLESIAPQERSDEAFAASDREILTRVREESGYPARILQNLTVNTVYESGLGSSFRQLAVQIASDEGARDWRTFPIQFDPAAQRVTIRSARVYRGGQRLEAMQTFEQQLGEPWYRIWYDTRALVIVFPSLQPDDVVELRWRIDDVAERNQFDDYYGDINYFAGPVPNAHVEHVLISPESRQFYFNEPRMRGLTRETRTENGLRVDRFVAEDVPAIQSEDNMPGMTEVAPYLHVSTYRDWESVGRWYWGLIRDQLYADENLRRVVADLVRDVPDNRTKVERIYEWVIRNTRYVGLEFGIHGFLPYRVPQIVERGFGDCKDKASLIYTMLREAGIEARIVLVRTRRNGAITDLPASLAVFDHAIAYVPELDLFLDGTAEHSGTTEFPQMDQGVTVLVVGPESAELRRTPVTPAANNQRARTIAMDLERDGSGRIEVTETIRGYEAPQYRETYQAEGTRHERFERALRNLFPGVELRESEFAGLTRYEEPIRIEYRAEVPQLAVPDADGLRIQATVLDDLTRLLARSERRRHPLDLHGTTSYLEERRIRLPANMRVLHLPAGGEASSEYGRFSLHIEQSEGEIVARTELSVLRDRIPVEEYEAFRRWVEQADLLLRQRIAIGARR